MRLRTGALMAVLLASGAMVMATCSSTPAPGTADHAFVEQMIPHHHLGMRLLEDATVNSSDVRLRRMAFEMDAYHSQEMERLGRWSRDWGVGTTTTFPGELTESEIGVLALATGTEHDTLWLALMIEHHRGALEITDAAQDATIAEVRAMAATIESVQRRQIDEMTELLTALCAESPSSSGCTGTGSAPFGD